MLRGCVCLCVCLCLCLEMLGLVKEYSIIQNLWICCNTTSPTLCREVHIPGKTEPNPPVVLLEMWASHVLKERVVSV